MSNRVGWWIGLFLNMATIILLLVCIYLIFTLQHQVIELRSTQQTLNKQTKQIECDFSVTKQKIDSMEWFLHVTPIVEQEYCEE